MGDINVSPDVLEIRWKAHEKGRKEIVEKLMTERNKVIAESSHKKNRYL